MARAIVNRGIWCADSAPVTGLHPAIEAFLAEDPSARAAGFHRAPARAAFWPRPDGGLGVAATSAWMRMVDGGSVTTPGDPARTGPGPSDGTADVLDAEACARLEEALRTGERARVVRRLAGSDDRWIEVVTWPLADDGGHIVATAAAATEIPEPGRPRGRTGAAAGGPASLATPVAPRVPRLRQPAPHGHPALRSHPAPR